MTATIRIQNIQNYIIEYINGPYTNTKTTTQIYYRR